MNYVKCNDCQRVMPEGKALPAMNYVKCNDCQRVMPEGKALPAKDIFLRHDPGDTFSDLECPDCGALCHPASAQESNEQDFVRQCRLFNQGKTIVNPYVTNNTGYGVSHTRARELLTENRVFHEVYNPRPPTPWTIRFPAKPWLPYCIRPSEAVLQALTRRKFLSLARRGVGLRAARHASSYQEEWQTYFDLPTETHRAVFTPEQWHEFKLLNGFRSTRQAALDLARSMPVRKVK